MKKVILGLILLSFAAACDENSESTRSSSNVGLEWGSKTWPSPGPSKLPYVSIGYVGNGATVPQTGAALDVTLLPWSKLTHVIEAFAVPTDTAGGVQIVSPGSRTNLISTAHSNATRIYLSVGGANASLGNFSASAAPAVVDTFVQNIMTLVTTNQYDGVDIDWEFPASSDKSNFTALLTKLSQALRATNGYDGAPRGLTFVISPGHAYCGVDWAAVASVVDYGILSGYEFRVGYYNGPLFNSWNLYYDCNEDVRQASIAYSAQTLQSSGFPLNQLVLGMPLFSAPSGLPLMTVLSGGTQGRYYTSAAEALYTYADRWEIVDTAQSFCDKMSWAESNGLAGISLWELSQAYPATDPLVSSLWGVVGGSSCTPSHRAY